MSYCNKGIKCSDIDNVLDYKLISSTLDVCENYCDRYFLCDTVAYMNDKLKEKEDGCEKL
jgi:hypothetical protein